MVPIFKKVPRYTQGNYRPVSHTSIVCKLLEGMIREHIQEFVDENSIISTNQHGFMNLLTFYEEVSCNLNKGRTVEVVYLDFSKAFATIPHTCLIYKLRSAGIDDCVCICIEKLFTGACPKSDDKRMF